MSLFVNQVFSTRTLNPMTSIVNNGMCKQVMRGRGRAIHSSRPVAFQNTNSFCSCCGMFGVNHPTITQQVARSASLAASASTPSQQLFQQQQRRGLTFTSMGTDEADGAHPHVDMLLNNNKEWIKQSIEKDPEFLKKLTSPQKPKYLYIGCSDSRVPANEILGLG